MKKAITQVFLAVILCVFSFTVAQAATTSTTTLLTTKYKVPNYHFVGASTPTAAVMLMGFYDVNKGDSLLGSNATVPLDTFSANTEHGTIPQEIKEQANSTVDNAVAKMAGDMGAQTQTGTGNNVSKLDYSNMDSVVTADDAMSNLMDGRTAGTAIVQAHYVTANNGSGAVYTAADAQKQGYAGNDETYGIYEFMKDAGYNIIASDVKSQATDDAANMLYNSKSTLPNNGVTQTTGFTFKDLEAQIDEGNPVLLDVDSVSDTQGTTSYSVLAYGYDSATETVYVDNTLGDTLLDSDGMPDTSLFNELNSNAYLYSLAWNDLDKYQWGKQDPTYYYTSPTNEYIAGATWVDTSGLSPNLTTTSQAAGPPAPTPEPCTLLLFGCGMIGLSGFVIRKGKAVNMMTS